MQLNLETVGKDQVKMTPERMKSVINQTYDWFVGPRAIQSAEDAGDQKHVRFLLQLQDFATIVEANQAMSSGDVGCMIQIWKHWSVMAHGMNCLKH